MTKSEGNLSTEKGQRCLTAEVLPAARVRHSSFVIRHFQ